MSLGIPAELFKEYYGVSPKILKIVVLLDKLEKLEREYDEDFCEIIRATVTGILENALEKKKTVESLKREISKALVLLIGEYDPSDTEIHELMTKYLTYNDIKELRQIISMIEKDIKGW